MRKIAFALPALAVALSSCAVTPAPQGPSNLVSSRPAAAPVNVGVDWNWMVSGDNAVRPVQVFSLNGKTYLQMDAKQIMPALIVNGTPIPFGISPPYLVIQGMPHRIEVVANGYRAIVAYIGPGQTATPAAPAPSASRVQRVSMAPDATQVQAVAAPVRAPAVEVRRLAPAIAPQPATPAAAQPTSMLARAQSSSRVERVQVNQRDEIAWQIDPRQQMLSHALDQWAQRVGMQVEWRAPIDVPIVGTTQYRTIFLMAFTDALADASGNGYRFLMGLDGRKIIVTAVRTA